MRKVTDAFNFYQGNCPRELADTFGSPLYVYNERIFRQRCAEMVGLSKYPKFAVNYAIKANTNLTLLKIAREEGCRADISSAGEVVAAMAAGFKADEMLFVVNNVSEKELSYAVEKGITVSVDSLSMLDKLGRINRGGRIALRFNPGVGGGHHEKVVTGGDGTKFGIMPAYIPHVRELLEKYDLKLIGINHHIGSQNWGDLYLEGVGSLLELARQFDSLEFIDLGGGFAIPYHKQDGEKPLDLKAVGEKLDAHLFDFAKSYGKEITFLIEPGRYLAAECGVLLGTVHATKTNGATHYAGTDLGFSVIKRPTLYDSHHDIEVYRAASEPPLDFANPQTINVVGNQCESGDYIARNRELPPLYEGDVLGVLDAGAYGFSMACQYNHRPRPAEVLIQTDNTPRIIRRRETFEDILVTMKEL
ncbi:MAG: diaminopimelate decarboxylase [Defluviitaleaceae bacterium]|nr:diaminopimelate decarboxylase [Defluviitaleaceae bacterium]MCL2262811.1 diaminopimelate decarboxylase [Defluviitaleaceae bacterium]MCL2263873.1 diaminopimelate decarboxylase [Defluviitaleaceae bacterium]